MITLATKDRDGATSTEKPCLAILFEAGLFFSLLTHNTLFFFFKSTQLSL